jgi:hypothetical protein
MAAKSKTTEESANRLLTLLTPEDQSRLRPHLEPVQLEYRKFLYAANKKIEFAYFIETGVGSLVITMASGQAAEVGTIGNEGIVGLPLVLGDDRAPTSVYVQVPGAGLRMEASLFTKELARNATMQASCFAMCPPCSTRSPSRRPAIISIRWNSAVAAGC